MKLKNIKIIFLLLIISLISFANTNKTNEMTVTDEGVTLKLKGLFSIYWDKNDDGEPACYEPAYGEMIFLPENKDIVNGKIIVLRTRDVDYYNFKEPEESEKFFDKMEKEKVEMLKKSFPKEFEKSKKTTKEQFQVPAEVTIKQLRPYTECDFTTVYGYVTDMKKIDSTTAKFSKRVNLADIEDGGNPEEPGYLERYEVRSKDGYTNLRVKPTTDSKILLKLKNGSEVSKIMSTGDWHYVYMYEFPEDDDETNEIKEYFGFIHKSQLKKVNLGD